MIFIDANATTEIYTLSLHDALPILRVQPRQHGPVQHPQPVADQGDRVGQRRAGLRHPRGDHHAELAGGAVGDRKSTRLNSSHVASSYAVFCLNKKIIMLLASDKRED